MIKKYLALLLALVLMTALFAGCTGGPSSQGSSDTGSRDGADNALFIGYSCMTFEDAYLVATGERIKALCEENGYKYTEMGAQGVAAKQVEQVENMVTMGCDVICVCPLDVDALTDAFKKAREQGVKIVFVGDPLEDASAFDVALNVSQFGFGEAAAQAAADWIDATFPDAADGAVEVAVYVNTVHPLFQLRADGLKKIEEFTSKAKIVTTYDLAGQDNSGAKCQEYTDSLFLSYPNCKVILAHSSDYGTSIDEVIMRTNGLDVANIGIFSCDWLQAAADSIKQSPSGTSAFRALIDSGDLGEAFFAAAIGEGKTDEKGLMLMPLTTVTVDNVDDAIASHQ